VDNFKGSVFVILDIEGDYRNAILWYTKILRLKLIDKFEDLGSMIAIYCASSSGETY